VKNGAIKKRIATSEDVVQLAKKMRWRDIHLSGGNVVTAQTSREIFQDAEKALKSKSRRKRAHAAVS
jgi:hypothetical protein